jgi:hypothetical protein
MMPTLDMLLMPLRSGRLPQVIMGPIGVLGDHWLLKVRHMLALLCMLVGLIK